jgi:hypothetical protein
MEKELDQVLAGLVKKIKPELLKVAENAGMRSDDAPSYNRSSWKAVAGNTARSKVVLDDEHRNGGVLGNHHWPNHAGLGQHHVIVLAIESVPESFLKR